MRKALDDAFADISDELPTLLAMVLSIGPDATITWAWSCDHEPRRALGFAALHRAATMCLDGLDGEQPLQRLLLTSRASWISSQPLRIPEDDSTQRRGPHFVVTAAFCGEIQAGMAVVQSARLRERIKAIVDIHREPDCVELRDALVELLSCEPAPVSCLAELSEDTGVAPAELGRLDLLNRQRQLELLGWVRARLSEL